MKTAFEYEGTRYIFQTADDGQEKVIRLVCNSVKIPVTWEKVYVVPVHDNPGFAYKINKKSVSAFGGAYGLFKYIKNCIEQDFCMCYVRAIIQGIRNNKIGEVV